MATSLLADIAIALTAKLNAETFTKALTVARIYDPEVKLEELAGGRIVVFPAEEESRAVDARNIDRRNLVLHVAIQAKLETSSDGDTEEIDGWLAYVDEVKEYLNRLRNMDEEPYFVVTGIEHRPAYSVRHLRESRLFFALIIVKVRVMWNMSA